MSALKAFCSSSSSKLKLLPFDDFLMRTLNFTISFLKTRQIVAGKIEIKKSYSIPESKVAMSALKASCSSSSSNLKLLPFDDFFMRTLYELFL